MIEEKYKIKKNKKKSWKGFILTNSAINQITFLIKKNNNLIGIKINIKNSGCAGYIYKLEEVFFYNKNDFVYKYKKIKIYAPLKIMPLIDGITIDYIQEDLNYVFKFYNPKVKNLCGCGESFNI
ncbi:iron-sulfur cluster assembly accessory protein [Sodalis-like secondary symbiont of Drepanosiphum platanoidis]|uniref:iron-sulfur cluster assembly accessory protein n=1 Tax=Sodalis-like secondary symbiont of Drepanosiphum platanoidis TaxID=2994493 RepID=UPI003464B32F